MKKAFLPMAVLLLLLVIFVACDANTPPSVDTDSTEGTSISVPAETHESPVETMVETTVGGSEPETSEPASEPVETAEPDSSVTDPIETEPVETPPVETDPVEAETSHTHAWSDWLTTKEATCTESGEEKRTCTCGETENRTLRPVVTPR